MTIALSKGYIAQIAPETDVEIYNLYMDGTVQGEISILDFLRNVNYPSKLIIPAIKFIRKPKRFLRFR